jgi:hypothetical protein
VSIDILRSNSISHFAQVENDAVLGDVIEDIYDEDEPDQLKPVQFDSICVYYLYHKFCDKDPKFMWKLYFRALPDQYDSTLFFSKDDLEQLKGSALYGKTNLKYL